MKLLKQLYEIHSPSGKETRIRSFIENYIKKNMPVVRLKTDKTGNLYITKGKSETYPCIVAHLDQVQKHHSKDFQTVETQDIIFGYSPSKRRYEGLGADDKNGIWIALQCLMKYDAVKVAFFVGEEVGCVGSNAADLTFFGNCRFVIEPDRRGSSDLITNISWESMCSLEFAADTRAELFGYKPEEGLMTDIEILREKGLALSCINVSCGYYEPHTDQEFTVKSDLLNCLDFVQHIIETCTKTYTHEREPYFDDFHYGQSRSCDTYDYYAEMIIDIIQMHPDYTVRDAWDVYHMNFPELSIDEFEVLYKDFRADHVIEEPIPLQVREKTIVNRKKIQDKAEDNIIRDSRSYSFFLGSNPF